MLRIAIPALILALALSSPMNVFAANAPLEFTVPPMDDTIDLHGDPSNAQLVIFVAGNQFMVMDDLISAFRRAYPRYTRIFYETLPPGILARQISTGSVRIGNLLVSASPDVFLAGKAELSKMRAAGLTGAALPYASNTLAIMVRAGNPKHVRSLRDLGRNDVRVAMPNPKWEGVAKQIERAYAIAGGRDLIRRIMVMKVAAGTTLLTQIHHRQTPLFILDGRADAGPVWITEALYQRRIGKPIESISIPAAANVTAISEAAQMIHAPHARAARAFLAFLQSRQARAIYRAYAFGLPRPISVKE